MLQVASSFAKPLAALASNFGGQVLLYIYIYIYTHLYLLLLLHVKEVLDSAISRRRLLARGHGLAEERAQEVEEAGNQDRDVHQVDILGSGLSLIARLLCSSTSAAIHSAHEQHETGD